MKSFTTSILLIILAIAPTSYAMRPHSFLIPNTEVLETSSTDITGGRRTRRSGNQNEENIPEDITQDFVRILRGNKGWGLNNNNNSDNKSSQIERREN
mmetsp:Transcript_27330/g.41896  ORF Transcript_27330/g.41896 Transcript_27330/m.41896 type:complete len:98 (-) Transcript_27330:382-675(-)